MGIRLNPRPVDPMEARRERILRRHPILRVALEALEEHLREEEDHRREEEKEG